jgi:hypothetical protein
VLENWTVPKAGSLERAKLQALEQLPCTDVMKLCPLCSNGGSGSDLHPPNTAGIVILYFFFGLSVLFLIKCILTKCVYGIFCPSRLKYWTGFQSGPTKQKRSKPSKSKPLKPRHGKARQGDRRPGKATLATQKMSHEASRNEPLAEVEDGTNLSAVFFDDEEDPLTCQLASESPSSDGKGMDDGTSLSAVFFDDEMEAPPPNKGPANANRCQSKAKGDLDLSAVFKAASDDEIELPPPRSRPGQPPRSCSGQQGPSRPGAGQVQQAQPPLTMSSVRAPSATRPPTNAGSPKKKPDAVVLGGSKPKGTAQVEREDARAPPLVMNSMRAPRTSSSSREVGPPPPRSGLGQVKQTPPPQEMAPTYQPQAQMALRKPRCASQAAPVVFGKKSAGRER